MNNDSIHNRIRSDRELSILISAVCDGTASADQYVRLEERLLADRAVLEFYCEYVELHNRLGRWARTSLQAKKPVARRGSVVLGLLEGTVDFLARPTGKSLLAASLLVALLYVVLTNPQPKVEERQTKPELAAIVARIGGVSDCEWKNLDSNEAIGHRLRSGDTVNLLAGLARIEFDAGASVILEGPAEFVVESTRGGRLNFGKLTAKVPKTSRGFSIATRLATIGVLGTAFGVSSDHRGVGAIHVFNGVVAVEPKAFQGTPGEVQRVAAEYSAKVGLSPDGESATITVAEASDDALAFVRSLQQERGEVIFQDGLNGYHQTMATFIRSSVRESSPDVSYDQTDTTQINFDSSPWLLTLEWGADNRGTDEFCRSLISFHDLFGNRDGQIPEGARIISAYLELKTTDEGYSDSKHRVGLFEIIVPWREDEVTWEIFGQGGLPGVHYRAESVASFSPINVSTVFNIDVTESLRRWSTDGGNNGWVLIDLGGDRAHFASDDAFERHERPRLVVIYESAETKTEEIK